MFGRDIRAQRVKTGAAQRRNWDAKSGGTGFPRHRRGRDASARLETIRRRSPATMSCLPSQSRRSGASRAGTGWSLTGLPDRRNRGRRQGAHAGEVEGAERGLDLLVGGLRIGESSCGGRGQGSKASVRWPQRTAGASVLGVRTLGRCGGLPLPLHVSAAGLREFARECGHVCCARRGLLRCLEELTA